MIALLLLACAGPEHTPPAPDLSSANPAPAEAPGRPRPERGPRAEGAARPTGTSRQPALSAAAAPVLARATAATPSALATAEQAGARLLPVDDTFAVAWEPPGATRTIVSLHGHSGWAHEDLAAWLPFAKQHGVRVVSVQWWVGTRDDTPDYLNPEALYRAVDKSLKAAGATPGKVLLHGFSRGSTVTYAVAAMDSGNARWFEAVVANAGGAHLDFPPTAAVDQGRYGARPFAGQTWTLFCGGRDPDPALNGCPAMRKTERWIEARGATATILEDPTADHGGFHKNARNADNALTSWLGG